MKEIYDIREDNDQNDPSLRGPQTSKESEKENMIKDPEVISNQFSSVIKDKYQDDMEAPTVMNKIADMIINIECKMNNAADKNNPDPEEIFHSDDEALESDDEDNDSEGIFFSDDETSDNENQQSMEVSLEELTTKNKLRILKKKINKIKNRF